MVRLQQGFALSETGFTVTLHSSNSELLMSDSEELIVSISLPVYPH